MGTKLLSKRKFATLAGVNPSTVTRLAKTVLCAAMDGERVDAAHPDAVAYLEKRHTPPTPPPATGIDTLYERAVEVCTNSGRWSQSYLQRELHVGYSRAKRIMDMLRLAGLVPDPQQQAPDQVAPTHPYRPLNTQSPEPKPPPPPADPPVDEAEPELPDNIVEVADLSIREVVQRYGTLSRFSDVLRSLKSIEDIHEKRLKNAQTNGTLVARRMVEVGIIDVFNSAHLRIMADGAKTIAAGVVSKHAAGSAPAEIENYVSDILGSFFKPVKGKVARTLKNA